MALGNHTWVDWVVGLEGAAGVAEAAGEGAAAALGRAMGHSLQRKEGRGMRT